MIYKYYFMLQILFYILVFDTAFSAEIKKTNFIIIFTDDQGYEDLGVFGSPNIKTPNIDKMANEGMLFTDFYSAAPICTPSRAALLTGCYPERVGGLRVLFPQDTIGLNPAETTIAKMLKNTGYETACIGKWHLGHMEEFLPTNNGFDYYFGIPYSNDMTIAQNMKLSDNVVLREGVTSNTLGEARRNWVPLMRNDEVIEYPVDQTTLTRRYTDEAITFIKGNFDRPFFLYLAHTMPHYPVYSSPEFRGKSAAGLYGDAIEEIDWNVGRILDVIRELDLDRNTLVIYTSDNGPFAPKRKRTQQAKGDVNRRVGGSAYPLRGFKFQTWEGGMRVPAVMWWPDNIPAGSENHEITATIDLLPTLGELSGAPLPEKKIDGQSIASVLRGKTGERSPHRAYFYKTEGVRVGKWKLINGQLFNLSQDISESMDIAEAHPEMVIQLSKLLNAHKLEMKRSARRAGISSEQ